MLITKKAKERESERVGVEEAGEGSSGKAIESLE
jgi:hypothetical protein